MGKCYHTGLPQSMCGHCNGTRPLEVEPPNLYAVKLPEKLGTSLGARGSMEAASAVVHGSLYTHGIRSEWGRNQALRTLAGFDITPDIAEAAGTVVNPFPVVKASPDTFRSATKEAAPSLRRKSTEKIPQYAASVCGRARSGRRIDVMKHVRAGTFSNNPHEGIIA